MFVLGEAVDGATAVAWGIANALVAPEELRPRARAAAEAVAAKPRASVRQTRRLLRNAEALASPDRGGERDLRRAVAIRRSARGVHGVP
jgi:enoyl-CoA hydratase/carnithine racemase